jgi:membrane protein required for colicin V production
MNFLDILICVFVLVFVILGYRKGIIISLATIAALILGVVAGVLLVAKLTEKIVDVVGMGFLNHIGGAILGFAKGVILCSIILFIVVSFDPKEKGITKEDKKGSITYRTVSPVFPAIIKLMGSKIKFPETNLRSP